MVLYRFRIHLLFVIVNMVYPQVVSSNNPLFLYIPWSYHHLKFFPLYLYTRLNRAYLLLGYPHYRTLSLSTSSKLISSIRYSSKVLNTYPNIPNTTNPHQIKNIIVAAKFIFYSSILSLQPVHLYRPYRLFWLVYPYLY